MEEEGGHGGGGGGGRPWRRWGSREAMEEEGGHGGDVLLGGAEESPLRGGNISHTSLERFLQEKAGTRGGD